MKTTTGKLVWTKFENVAVGQEFWSQNEQGRFPLVKTAEGNGNFDKDGPNAKFTGGSVYGHSMAGSVAGFHPSNRVIVRK